MTERSIFFVKNIIYIFIILSIDIRLFQMDLPLLVLPSAHLPLSPGTPLKCFLKIKINRTNHNRLFIYPFFNQFNLSGLSPGQFSQFWSLSPFLRFASDQSVQFQILRPYERQGGSRGATPRCTRL